MAELTPQACCESIPRGMQTNFLSLATGTNPNRCIFRLLMARYSLRARSITRSFGFSSKHSNHQSPVCRGQVHLIFVRVNISLHRAARRQANKNFWCDETCSMEFFLRHSRQEWQGYSEISALSTMGATVYSGTWTLRVQMTGAFARQRLSDSLSYLPNSNLPAHHRS